MTILRRAASAALIPFTAAAVVLAPAPAMAHDVLTGSSPEDGDTVDTVPEEVVLTFNNPPMESPEASAIVVTGPDGEEYQDGALVFDGTDVSVPLLPIMDSGDYTLAFQVVSSDGHPIQDSLEFTVSEEAAAAAAPEETEEPAEEEAPADEAGEETADPSPAASTEAEEGALSVAALVVVGLVALAGIGAVVLVAVRLRNRPGGS
ncbi:copper resistance CopC family protein [Nocardiopsis sp. NRRL B-16309]|uniref:copper resistance CopC family protein n=1 Tax=Nocardiopsis sp. NRRL B-16309 TaxID=1519494 RepID=UPI000ACA7C1D|nr:copper resistance CopC family protein [Nocardiopsis sp. NRRL B-16309]